MDPVHVHCGDCAGVVARRAGLPGQVLVWRDSSAVGPCSAERERHARLRAEWWGVAAAEIQDASALPADRELALWFGPDPWEQVSLVEVLAGALGPSVSIVPLDAGVALMSPGALAPRFSRRRGAADLKPAAAECWRDLCADHRPALREWARRFRGEPRLPHLAAAIERVLDDRDDRRTERQVRALLAAGVTEMAELMRRLAQAEAPGHGAWYGDVVVRRLRDQVTAGP
jgi:hypothetical protein